MSITYYLNSLAPFYGLRINGDSAWIKCPWHKGGNERTPSLKINLNGMKAPIGAFYCFACKEHGNWDKLADELNIKYKSFEKDVENLPDDLDTDLFPSDSQFENDSYWPKSLNWRGIKGQLLHELNAKYGKPYFFSPGEFISIHDWRHPLPNEA